MSSRRQTVQYIHFWGGVAWLGALAAVIVLGGRRLLATAHNRKWPIVRFSHDAGSGREGATKGKDLHRLPAQQPRGDGGGALLHPRAPRRAGVDAVA